MITVRIIKNWTNYWMSDASLIAQTPQSSCRWGDVRFTLDDASEADYVIVLNRPTRPVTVRIKPSRIWGVIQEPPNELYAPMHRGQRAFAKVLTSHGDITGGRFVQSHPALPWFVEKSYDELVGSPPVSKGDAVCCVTSANKMFKGHVRRLRLLHELCRQFPLEVFGRGIRPIERKWDTVSRCKYSLVLENYIGDWYWTEKLADCFLAWTIPFYIGCPRVGEYFPKGSFILLNGRSAAEIRKEMQDASEGGFWEKNLDALAEARRRILSQYSMFPYLAGLVEAHHRSGTDASTPARDVRIHSVTPSLISAWTRAKLRASYVNFRAMIGCPVIKASLLDFGTPVLP
jgi:Glycosyltransferase family 10 (fucosyltransferase) C-term